MTNMQKLIILDNGHGKETPGKRSPVWSDGTQLFEYEFNRDVVQRIAAKLKTAGIPYHILVPELTDISLEERCKRANAITKEYKAKGIEAILISIHANAGGGKGWECYTSPGKTKSDTYAEILYKHFCDIFGKQAMRVPPLKEERFFILINTSCPAILTENFFMDTLSDCQYLMSDKGRETIAYAHVQAIKEMLTV